MDTHTHLGKTEHKQEASWGKLLSRMLHGRKKTKHGCEQWPALNPWHFKQHSTPSHFQYPSYQIRPSKVNQRGLGDSPEPWKGIPKQGNSRSFHRRSQGFDRSFCHSLFPQVNLSSLHPNSFPSRSFLCVLQEEDLCMCAVINSYEVPNLTAHHSERRKSGPTEGWVRFVPPWGGKDQRARNIHF